MKKERIAFSKFKYDILLLGVLLAAGTFIFLFALFNGQGGTYVRVKVDGKITAEYSLKENRTVTLNGKNGINVLVIENGEAYISEADCPDKLCVRQGKINMNGQSVICLPHKTVIEITGENKNDKSNIDIIVN